MTEAELTPSQRWDELSRLQSLSHDRMWDKVTEIWQIAHFLSLDLTAYLGIPVDRSEDAGDRIRPVRFYRFKAGHEPAYDQYEEVESSIDAIQVADGEFWTFGMSIQLEMGPRITPRYGYQWWVRIKYEDQRTVCRLGMREQQPIYINKPFNKEAFFPLSKAVYAGLVRHLSNLAFKQSGERSVGFRIAPE